MKKKFKKIYQFFLFVVFASTLPLLYVKYFFDFLLSKIIYFRKGNIFFKSFLINKPYLRKVFYKDISISVIINSYYDIWRIENYKSFFLDDLFEDRKYKKIYYYDIGANTGFSSIIASKKLLKKIETYAIEIEPANYKTLCDNALLNNLKNFHPMNLGLSNKKKIIKFFYNTFNVVEKNFFFPSSSIVLHSTKFVKKLHNKEIFFKSFMMPFDKLINDFKLPQPTHLFIDAFGSEQDIIKGMSKTLSSKKIKKVYMDIEDKEKNIEKTWVYKYLTSKNFIIKNILKKNHSFAKNNWNVIFEKKIKN